MKKENQSPETKEHIAQFHKNVHSIEDWLAEAGFTRLRRGTVGSRKEQIEAQHVECFTFWANAAGKLVIEHAQTPLEGCTHPMCTVNVYTAIDDTNRMDATREAIFKLSQPGEDKTGYDKLLTGLDALTKPKFHELNRHAGRNDRLLHALLFAYAKLSFEVDDITDAQAMDTIHDALCNELDDESFIKWKETMEQFGKWTGGEA